MEEEKNNNSLLQMKDVENFMGIPAEAFVRENASKIHPTFYAHDAMRIVATAASDRNRELRKRDTTDEFFDRLAPIASSSTTTDSGFKRRVSPTNSDSDDLKEISEQEFRARKLRRKGAVDVSPERNLQNQTKNLVHHATLIITVLYIL
jgi:hypothetical protein